MNSKKIILAAVVLVVAVVIWFAVSMMPSRDQFMRPWDSEDAGVTVTPEDEAAADMVGESDTTAEIDAGVTDVTLPDLEKELQPIDADVQGL